MSSKLTQQHHLSNKQEFGSTKQCLCSSKKNILYIVLVASEKYMKTRKKNVAVLDIIFISLTSNGLESLGFLKSVSPRVQAGLWLDNYV